MKKLLLVQVACIAMFLMSVFSAHGQCLTSWKYYMPVTVTNNVSSSLSDYQVKVTLNTASLITAGKMSSTGDDIRFVDPITCNTLYYWIESGINTSATVIWVKMPSLSSSANKTIRIYYGNSSASATSDGDNTFVLFDDFNGSSLNTSKWSTYGQSGTASVSSGTLNLSTPSTGRYQGEVIVSTGSFSSPIIVEENLKSISGYWNGLGVFNSGTYDGYSSFCGTTSTTSTMNMGEISHTYNAFGAPKTYVNSSPGTITGIWQLAWPSTGAQLATWPGGTLSGTSTSFTLGSSVQVGAGMITESNGSISIDWMRVRAYAAKEATTSKGSEFINGSIEVSALSGSPFCTSSDISINIPFTISGNLTFVSGNIFTAQISDSSGSFANPTNIGTVSTTSAGTISATIPSGGYGLHYQIRVVSSTNSAYIGNPSASVLQIVPRGTPGFKINATAQCLKNNKFSFNNATSGTGTFTYKWNYGDGSTSNATSPIYTYANPGKYIVKLIIANIAGCTDTASQVVNVNNAVASFSANNGSQCFNGNVFSFSNTTSGYGTLTYLWNFGDGNTSTSSSPSGYSYSASGIYKVKLYATSNGSCTDSTEQTITVNPKVFAGFKINNTVQCLNSQNLTFTNNTSISSGTLTYKWSFGDGGALSSATNPSYIYKNIGSYIVKLTSTSDKGCTDTISKTVQVVGTPGATAKAAGPVSFCQGSQVLLSGNTSNVYTYQWLRDNFKISPSGTGQTYYATTTGSYKVVVSNTNGCSDTSSQIKVLVYPTPSKPLISQKGRILSSTKSISYQWILNGNTITGANSQSYKPDINVGTYAVMITDSNGCNNTSDSYKYDVSGIDNSTKNTNIHIYPNPAHDKFLIDLNSNAGVFQTIEITDISGKLLFSIKVDRSPIIEIPVSGLSKGMYFIRCSGINDTVIEKVAVQ